MRWTLLSLLALLSLASLSWAAVPHLISLQGTVTYANGTTLSSGSVNVSVFDNVTGGNLVYQENFTSVISNGTFEVLLGATSVPLNLLSNRRYYLLLTVENEVIDLAPADATTNRTPFTATGGPLNFSELSDDPSLIFAAHFNNNTLTMEGEAASASGVSFAAGRFGLGANVTGPATLSYSTLGSFNREEGTLSVWARFDTPLASGTTRMFFDTNPGFPVERNRFMFKIDEASYKLEIRDKDGAVRVVSFSVAGLVGAGELHHFAASWKDATDEVRLYLDGRLVNASVLPAWDVNETTVTFTVGQAFGTSAHWVNGTLDEFLIFDRALTPLEVSALHQSTGEAQQSQEHAAYQMLARSSLPGEIFIAHFNGNGISGTGEAPFSGAPTAYLPGRFGQAANFSTGAALNYSSTGKNPPGNEVTVEAWIRGSPGNSMTTCCQGIVTTFNYGLELVGGGISFFVRNSTSATFAESGAYPLIADVWYHVAGVYDGSRVRLYVDGQEVRSFPQTGNVAEMNASSFLSIGSEDGRLDIPGCCTGRYFKGLIDEAAIHFRALPPDEIRAHYLSNSQLFNIDEQQAYQLASLQSTGSEIFMAQFNKNLRSAEGELPAVTGSVPLAQGRFHGAADFASASALEYHGASGLAPQQYTVMAWVQPDSVGSLNDALGGVIMSKDSTGGLGISVMLNGPGNTNRFDWRAGFTDGTQSSVQSANTFPFGQWYHVAGTWDGNALRLYVNGRLEGTTVVGPKTVVYTAHPVSVGSHSALHGTRRYDGRIDEVIWYAKALSESEIRARYLAQGELQSTLPPFGVFRSCTKRFTSGTGNPLFASCLAGETVTGGGCFHSDSTGQQCATYRDGPSGASSWECRWLCTFNTNEAWVICCS